MTKVILMHEVKDAAHWAKAWHVGPGSRHEIFASIDVTVTNFCDPQNPTLVGLLLDVPDMGKLEALLGSEQAAAAMAEDGVKTETMRIVDEFTP